MLYTHHYTPQGYYLTNPQQLGPIYFKTPNKCGIFGICCESIPWQIKYFIDESVATGKGANSTISYVHDLLEKHGARKTNVHIHADNCGSQNKNNCHWYWCWHVIHGILSPSPNLSRTGALASWSKSYEEHSHLLCLTSLRPTTSQPLVAWIVVSWLVYIMQLYLSKHMFWLAFFLPISKN